MTNPTPSWQDAFHAAAALPASASPQEKASRGRKFEQILSLMFDEAGLSPRLSYRPQGEEIDGSIWLDGRTVLVEAKWTSMPHAASSIYQFKGKVDGKLAGTIGIFISMAGFSKDAVDALVAGKNLNVILFDGDDIVNVVHGQSSIIYDLRHKLRAAGEEGVALYPLAPTVGHTQSSGRRLVVVEGTTDVLYLNLVRQAFGVASEIMLIPAAGPMNMGRLIKALLGGSDDISSVVGVIDGDLQGTFVSRLKQELEMLTQEGPAVGEIIVIEPDLETALGLAQVGSNYQERTHLRRPSRADLASAISTDDLLRRAATDSALESLLRAIGVFDRGTI
jgi:hypothetical protein